MAGDVGTLLWQKKEGRELRLLTLTDGNSHELFYLKRQKREPVSRLIGVCLSGHRPHSGPLRELAALNHLRQAGFAVMEPVAWGEQRWCGLPVAGFLVVKSVTGGDVAQLFTSLRGQERFALVKQVGLLIGRLHAAGFYQNVRLKDLILDQNSGDLVLIDRETSRPWPKKFSAQRAIASLARSGRRTLRDGQRPGPSSLRHFFSGYGEGVAASWQISARELRKLAMKRLREELNRNN